MKLTLLDRTDLVVRSLRELARLQRAPSHVLAENIGTSPGFLTQALKPLVDAGILSTNRGPGGGYRFSRDPDDLSMLEIIEVVEGPTDDGRCVLENATCPGRTLCSMHDAWVSARSALTETLRNTQVLATTTQEVSI